MEDLAVEQDPVLLLSVVPEPFPVVGDQEDDRAVVEAVALEPADQLPDDGVGRRDLGVVGHSVAAAERLGRLVGKMRLVDVHEEEERPRLHALDPGHGAANRLAAGPLQQAHVARPLHVAAHGIVEEVHGVVDAGRAAQHVARHGGPRGVAVRPEDPGQRRARASVEVVAEVRPHAVLRREQARQHRQVRGEGQRTLAVGVLEEYRVALQGVDVRGLHPGVAVGGEVVGAEGVDGDQDHGSARELRRTGGSRPAPGRQGQEDEGQARSHGHRSVYPSTTIASSLVSERARRGSAARRCGSGPAARRSERRSIPPEAARPSRERGRPRPLPARTGARRSAGPRRGR